MKKTGKLCALLLVFLLALVLPTAVFAAKGGNGKQNVAREKPAVTEALTEEELAEQEAEAAAEAAEAAAEEAAELAEAAEETALEADDADEELTPEELLLKKTEKAEAKAAKKQLKLTVGHKPMKMENPPVIKDGRVLIPLRAMAAITGAVVSYDAELNQVTLVKEGLTIVIPIGVQEGEESPVTVNGAEVDIDVPAQIMDGRTFVPLRFVAETMNLAINYIPETDEVTIEEPVDEPAPEVAADPIVDPAPEVTPEVVTDPIADPTPEVTPEVAADPIVDPALSATDSEL